MNKLYFYYVKAKLFKTILFLLISVISENALSKNQVFAETDTLHVMISEKNNIYYYENELIEDASNFISASAKGIRIVVEDFSRNSKAAGHKSVILLKIMKESSLDKLSKDAIDFIKQKNYKQVPLREVEKQLIIITERQ